MARVNKPNVAVVVTGHSDEITITLIGQRPPGVPAEHVFTGQGLKQIDMIMLDLGVHVIAWLVTELPMLRQWALPLVLIEKDALR